MSSAEPAQRRVSAQEAAGEAGGLFARHGRMVYGICRAMLRDVHEAEDATQQVFLSAHKALMAGADVRDPGGWLATIARNECRGRIAAGMRRPLPVADEDLEAIADPTDPQAQQARRDEIRSALSALPERQREAVVLRYLYGLRYGEVATALGVSKPATEALLFRARRAMRTSLRPVAGASIAVPVAVRDELALALPGFEERAAPIVLGAGAAGGFLAKLAAGGAGVKVATATVAVVTVGAVGTVGPDRPTVPRAQAAVEQPSDDSGVDPNGSNGQPAGDSTRDDDSAGSHGGVGSSDDDRSSQSVSHGSSATDDRATDDDTPGEEGRSSEPPTTSSDEDDESSGTATTSPEDRSGSSDESSSDTDDDDDRSGSGDSSGSSGSGSGSSGSGNDDDRLTTEDTDSTEEENEDEPDRSGSGSGSGDEKGEDPSGDD